MRQIIIALTLLTTPLSAAIFHEINTTQSLCCTFSSKHHNRILIDKSRIKKIIFPEDKLYVRIEEGSGQVFVQAKNLIEEKIVVSIISQEGLVQDIEIQFVDQPSQVVILREYDNQPAKPLQELHSCQGTISKCGLKKTIESILNRKIPDGYVSAPITQSTWKIKPGISAKLVGYLKGAYEDLYIYQVRNTRLMRKCLLEKELVCPNSPWVFLEKNYLKSRETVLAIVAVKP